MVFVSVMPNAREVKLRSDVEALNRSVQQYISDGGTVAGVSTASGVLNKLKSVAANADRIAGYRGSYIDLRTYAVMQTEQEASAGQVRAEWDEAGKSFTIVSSGPPGVREFKLAAGGGSAVAEVRAITHKLAVEDDWIWDFADSPLVGGSTTTDAGPGDPVEPGAPSNPDALEQLSPPMFNPSGGVYDSTLYPLDLTLANPNPAGSSTIYYSMDGNAWQPYTDGDSIALTGDQAVAAYAAPLLSQYRMSFVSSELYFISYKTFSGNTTGVFTDPVGGGAMVSNIPVGSSDSYFEFGEGFAPLGYTDGNSLEFTGANFVDIEPNELFQLGTIEYFNSTTRRGTSAVRVTLRITINIIVPSITRDIDLILDLESTPNYNHLDDDQKADYVRISDLYTDFSLMLNEERHYMQLQFGYTGSEGFATIDQFHVHENASASGELYGIFTTEPTAPPAPPPGRVGNPPGAPPLGP